jgi:hypothetical protein
MSALNPQTKNIVGLMRYAKGSTITRSALNAKGEVQIDLKNGLSIMLLINDDGCRTVIDDGIAKRAISGSQYTYRDNNVAIAVDEGLVTNMTIEKMLFNGTRWET